jgi:nondiscriminating aspartyl-tRNA synthetase
MLRSLSLECLEKTGEEVTLEGWVQVVRAHGKIAFLDLRDRSGTVQVGAFEEKLAHEFGKLGSQDVIRISGKVKERDERYVNKESPTGTIEIEANKLEVIAKSEEMPFDMGGRDLNLELPTLLDHRGLTLRHPKISAIFKVQEIVVDSFRNALKEKAFTEFQSPVIIPQAAEGGSEVFEVDYFGHKAYLSQSPQFYKQILVGVFERVFTVNKTLRAEPSITTRHLAESTTLDAEFGFINSWIDVLGMAEYAIKYVLNEVNLKCVDQLAVYGAVIPRVTNEIPRIKLREAQDIIFKRTKRDNRNEPDLTPEDEREISKWSHEEKGSDLVFVTHYPVEKRPFYTFEDPQDSGYTLSADLIGRGVEWMTGGQRINDLKKLIENAKKRNIDLAKSELYFQAFKYGMPPEGGFSFGSERIVMNILGLSNIREASLFPRDMERVDERFSAVNEKNILQEK